KAHLLFGKFLELGPQIVGDIIQFSLRLREVRTRAQPANHAQETKVARTFLNGITKRDPCLNVSGNTRVRGKDQLEVVRHHAYHRHRAVSRANGLADNLRIGSVSPTPQVVTQQDDALTTATFFLAKECPAQRRLGAEHGEKVGGDLTDLDLFRFAFAGQRAAAHPDAAELLK